MRRRLVKSAVKSPGSTGELPLILANLSTDGAGGMCHVATLAMFLAMPTKSTNVTLVSYLETIMPRIDYLLVATQMNQTAIGIVE